MKKNISILATLLTLTALAHTFAQSPPTQPATPPTTSKILLELPMNPGAGLGEVITLPITIHNKDFLFVLDTGSTATILDPSITDLGDPISSINAHTLDDRVKTNIFHAPPMSLHDLPLSLDKVAAADFTPFRQASGEPIMGILGMDFLSRYIVQLDFKNRRVLLLDPASPYAGPGDSFNLGYTDHTPIILIDFLGQPHSAAEIDTGMDSAGAVRSTLPDTLPKNAITRHDQGDAAAINGRVKFQRFLIHLPWQLAGTRFTDLRLDAADHNVLGIEILADFIVTLDFPHDKLFLDSILPNHPAPPPYFGISASSQNGKWIFTTIDDRAKSLGIQPNDEILAVNGKPAPNLPRWQLAPRDTKTLTLEIKRNNQTLQITVPAE